MGGAGVIGFLGALGILVIILFALPKSNDNPPPLSPTPGTEPPGHVTPIEPPLSTNSEPGEVHFAPTTKYTPPTMVPGKDHKYNLGTGQGRMEIWVYGRELSGKDKKYWSVKGPWLVDKFKKVTSFGSPKGFYYSVYLYTDRKQFKKVLNLGARDRTYGISCWSGESIIAPIHTMDDLDVMTHEMVHSIQWAAYKSFPLFFTEGMANWLAHSYTHSTRNVSKFYQGANIQVLARQIRSGGFPEMESYLACENYDDWEKLLGSKWKGYHIGAMLCDYLFTNHQVWVGRALQHCQQAGKTQEERSKAFADFVKNNWDGGYKDLDAKLQNWILSCAKTYK